MSKRRKLLNALSICLLTVPNVVYLLCEIPVLKDVNAITLTMTALIVLSIAGLGALAHFKLNGGVWTAIIGACVIALSNVAWVAGIALIIEGLGLAIDGYVVRPAIKKEKIKELEADGKQVTYTTDIK